MDFLPFANPFTWGIVWWLVFVVETIMVSIISYKPIRDRLDEMLETEIVPIAVLAAVVAVLVAMLVGYVFINCVGLFTY